MEEVCDGGGSMWRTSVEFDIFNNKKKNVYCLLTSLCY